LLFGSFLQAQKGTRRQAEPDGPAGASGKFGTANKRFFKAPALKKRLFTKTS
jgi:hypothetical protein